MLSLGLGLALLVTVVEIDGNLRREFAEALPDQAPSFFFLDIPAADAARFDAFARQAGAGLDASSACRCCAAASSPQMAWRRRISSRRPDRAGCCAATAASLTRPPSPPARASSPVIGGAPTIPASRWCRSRTGRRRIRIQDRRHRHGQRARPQHHRADRQSSRRRLGEPRHQLRPGILTGAFARRAA